MSIEVNTDKAVCVKCGTGYSRRKGHFSVSYASLHKGIGYIPVCKNCVDKMYNEYLAQCDDPRLVVRQMCRKLDLYWSDGIFDAVSKKFATRSMMTQYIAKLNSITYAGKSYDDTLGEEGTLWKLRVSHRTSPQTDTDDLNSQDDDDGVGVPKSIVAFWGSGYTPSMYAELEQRRAYYMSKFPEGTELDIGSEVLVRQLCNLEVNIAYDSAAGKSIDKSVNTLNQLLGSLNLKPAQKKENSDGMSENTPFGVWIRRFENERPIPEPDPELKDVDGIIRYISIYFLGHLCKMLNIPNTYCKLYEEEIAKRKVNKPEYDDEDDETVFNDIFSSDDTE